MQNMVSSFDKLSVATDGETTEVFSKLPRFSLVNVEPVGRWHKALCQRRRQKQTLSHTSLRSSSSDESDENLSDEEEEDDSLLLTLDPKEWKDQDHYAVLGLSKLRVNATDDQIKRAYKKKVLKHHPDKRRARGLAVKSGEDDYFTCITRAWETLGHPTKRRSYDSVDPTFEDSVPSNSAESKENFFKLFGPVFERNARWSNKRKVPLLGDNDTNFEDVDSFYAFWYDFDSWREFSYLDEEEKEKGENLVYYVPCLVEEEKHKVENREERRWIEKQNKAARAKRKKEETTRIRNLVDNAYACDPRIARFKEEAKQKKLQEKEAKKEAARKRQEEEEKKKQAVLEEERKQKEKEEEEAKAKAAVAKKEREAQKKAFKKERKTLRTKVQEYEYFASTDDEKMKNMQDVEKLAEQLTLEQLQEVNKALTSGNKEDAKAGFLKGLGEVTAKLEKEKQELREAQQKQAGSGEGRTKGVKSNWGAEETALLIKAVNLFPAGTVQRWETVASFLSQHCEGSKRNAKEVLAKAKDLQKNDSALREDANKKAFDKFSAKIKNAPEVQADGGASQRYMSVAESVLAETGSNPAPWTAEEQKLLEQAIRTYPSSLADRWDKIAESIPSRSKKDCMKRFKELAEMVRAKKLAQIEAQKKAQKK